MNLRCPICSAWLNIFQTSSLCDVCLKIARIVKATTNIRCLNVLEENIIKNKNDHENDNEKPEVLLKPEVVVVKTRQRYQDKESK